MEEIYPISLYKASDHCELKSHLKSFSALISNEQSKKLGPISSNNKSKKAKAVRDYNIMKNLMGVEVSKGDVEKLFKTCSVEHLDCNENPQECNHSALNGDVKSYVLRTRIPNVLPIPDCAKHLEVLKRKEALERIKPTCQMLAHYKFNFHASVVDHSKDVGEKDLTLGSDFVMNIFLYKPFAFNFGGRNNTEKFRFSHEIQMLGKNTLTQLRDTIWCSSDSGLRSEVQSTTEDLSYLYQAKEKYPSGFIFIDGVFYNDMRSPKAIDYSEVVRKWALNKGVGDFKSADMETTQLDSLTPRLGYPYVYMHQGDCEHLLVFSDAHLLNEEDCLISTKYPRVSAMNRSASIMCYMCNLVVAKWVCKNYSRFPQAVTFLCTDCCTSYNFINGEKVGTFNLYPLLDKFVDNPNLSS